MTPLNMPALRWDGGSMEANSSCPVDKLALHRLDLGESKQRIEEGPKRATNEQSGGDAKAEITDDGRMVGNVDDSRAAQKMYSYKALRRSISRPEHEVAELQRPHSSHGCQSSDVSSTQPQMSHPSAAMHHRPRTRSPYSWTTYRSRSANIGPASPPKVTETPTAAAAKAKSTEIRMATTSITPSAAHAVAVPLERTRSSPAVIPHGPIIPRPVSVSQPPNFRPTSPFRAPVRVRSPFRCSQLSEDQQQQQQQFGGEFASISEDSELEIAPRSFPSSTSAGISGKNTNNNNNIYPYRSSSSPCSSSTSSYLSSSVPYNSITATASRSSRRPNSPMRHVSAPTSVHSSPLLAPAPTPIPNRNNTTYPSQFNEIYPLPLSSTVVYGSTALSSSSVPSTPTSTRSRSPSISSLETIPDSPRAEKAAEAALAAAEAAAIAAASTAATDSASTSPEAVGGGSGDEGAEVAFTGAIPRIPASSSSGIAVRDKRKRWSVCGAESRRDLDLETIWED